MAGREPHFDDIGDTPHHLAGRPHYVLAGWIVTILLLLAAVLAIGPDRVFDRAPEAPANLWVETVSGTGDVAMDDHAFAPGAIVAHPDDRIVFHNVGKDLQALTLVGHAAILHDALVDPGAAFTFVVPPTLGPGTYRILCSTHADMTLRLVVRAGIRAEPTGNSPGAWPRGGIGGAHSAGRGRATVMGFRQRGDRDGIRPEN